MIVMSFADTEKQALTFPCAYLQRGMIQYSGGGSNSHPRDQIEEQLFKSKVCVNTFVALRTYVFLITSCNAHHSTHNTIYFEQSTCKKSKILEMHMMTVRAENN